MFLRVLSGFKCKILCDIDSEKKAEGGVGTEVRNHLQRERCQRSKVRSRLWGASSLGGDGRCPVVLLTTWVQPRLRRGMLMILTFEYHFPVFLGQG